MEDGTCVGTFTAVAFLHSLVLPEGEAHGLAKDRVTLFDDSVLILSLEQLRVVHNYAGSL